MLNAVNNFKTRTFDRLRPDVNYLFLDDVDGLPNTPFLLTINNNRENMEIVKVTKVYPDYKYVDIERGQEGTEATEHAAGSIVENNFTAGTYHSLLDELENKESEIERLETELYRHLSETGDEDVHELMSSGKLVEERGSNNDGSFIRYSNGVQICSFTSSEETDLTLDGSKSGELYFASKKLTFPKFFFNTPDVTPLVRRISALQWAGLRSRSREDADIYMVSPSSSARGYLGFIAIGRWK